MSDADSRAILHTIETGPYPEMPTYLIAKHLRRPTPPIYRKLRELEASGLVRRAKRSPVNSICWEIV